MTANTALRLSRYFGTTPELWMNLQKTYELRVAEIEAGADIAERVQPRIGDLAMGLSIAEPPADYDASRSEL